MDKEAIKKELVDKSNNILEKYSEPDTVESVSVMNMAAKTVFLGSLKVFNTEVIPNVIRDLEKDLKGYGQLVVRDQKVTPCCSPSYTHISFNITITNYGKRKHEKDRNLRRLVQSHPHRSFGTSQLFMRIQPFGRSMVYGLSPKSPKKKCQIMGR